MRRIAVILIAVAMVFLPLQSAAAFLPEFRLGNEVLYTRYHHLIEGKRIGLITNQSGVNSQGRSTIDVLASDPTLTLAALFGPEHGIDGKASAGARVESYQHPTLNIPVYSLYGYGEQRFPTEDMLKDLDVLVYDIQDIGARTYTYISTLHYVMQRAKQYGKPVVVLDRPNPLGGETVEGPVLEDYFETFVGVDNLPMAHGMTVGELARFFNREIGADLTVVPMEGYTRDMIFQDTGLEWVQTSPNIPDIDSVFGYMATGLGEGTGIRQRDTFRWIGGKGIDSDRFAALLNSSGLLGVEFVPETIGSEGGVRLRITDYRQFNPAKCGLYALAYAKQLTDFAVPKSGSTPSSIVMFDKIMGTNRVGQWLEAGLSPYQMEGQYAQELAAFKHERQKYLIYGYAGIPGEITVTVNNVPIFFDSAPYIDSNNRTMVPLRAISEGLGAEVGWDPVGYVVTVVKDDLEVILTIGDPVAFVNGEARTMDTVPVIRNDRTMVPMRFVAEFLNAQVGWDGVHRVVTVIQ
ncbi:MAG: exo-beta-N-acetylmuramidase NamZ domain-containing protein [Bacillota bacterium]|jgi:uncharacterized protein YbbC (DUF1343 family)